MKRTLLFSASMSIFAIPLIGATTALPEPFSFQRYASLSNAAFFGASTEQSIPPPGIKSVEITWDESGVRQRVFLYDGRMMESVRRFPIFEDCIMYPVLPPKRPRQ